MTQGDTHAPPPPLGAPAAPPGVINPDPFAAYAPASAYDELANPDGTTRPGWARAAAALAALGPDELDRRRRLAGRMADEHGLTYRGYAGPDEPARPWPPGPIPFVFAEPAWQELAAALAQRHRVVNAMLADLLGPRRLIQERVLPPALLYANTAFRHAYAGLPVADDRYATLYAADLLRGPDGAFRVIADRARAPAGLGFALENRIIANRVHRDVLQTVPIRRLAPFFVALRDAVAAAATQNRDNPRVALWSDGPDTQEGFEDTFLARYLGYTLAEAEDLATRGGRLVLKTLGGPREIDVVFRRVTDDLCDPVELDGAGGVAGLLEALRDRRAGLVNALGARLAESPALLPFMPGVCRFFFAEDLRLPAVDTWWCGQPAELDHVLANLETLSIRPAFPTHRRSVEAGSLSAAARDELARAIRAHPERFVAHERTERSTTPVLFAPEHGRPARLEPWSAALRVYAVDAPSGHAVMPGALARVSPTNDAFDHALAAGNMTKDCWVVTDAPEPGAVSLLSPAGETLGISRGGAELPSRVAEDFAALGKALERAEYTARLLRTAHVALAGDAEAGQLEPAAIVSLLAARGLIDPPAPAPDTPSGFVLTRPLADALHAADLPQSLRATIDDALRAAAAVRDRLSTDAWRALTRLDRALAPGQNAEPAETTEQLDEVIALLAAFAGFVSESTTRTLGWRFLDIGRRVGRAKQTLGLIEAALASPLPDERPALAALLDACDSAMTYRVRYLAGLQPLPALDLLLMDETNPRAAAYQFAALDRHLAALPHDTDDLAAPGPLGRRDALATHLDALPDDHASPLHPPERRAVMALLNLARLADTDDLAAPGPMGRRDALATHLAALRGSLDAFDEAMANRYFIHAGVPRQFLNLGTGAHTTPNPANHPATDPTAGTPKGPTPEGPAA